MSNANFIKNTNEENFSKDILESQGLKLVDFWAPWCGPCLKIAPALEKIAEDLAGQVEIQKLNVDENPGLASEYGIRGIPTLLLFRDGKEVDRIVGAVPAEQIKQSLNNHLS